MTTLRGISLVAALLVAACTSATPPASATEAAAASRPEAKAAGGGGDSCQAHQRAATSIVLAAIEKARACTKDADCLVVSVGASCFDACTGAIGAGGKAAYDRAVEEANAKECAAFFKDGCKLPMPPPCAPQPPVACLAGSCK